MSRRWALTLALLAAGAAVAEAADRDDPGRINPLGLTAGAAIVGGQTLYAGIDKPDALLVPFLGYEGERFYIRGLRAGLTLWRSNGIRLDALVQPRFDHMNPGDSDALEGMERRRRSLDGGLRASWRSGPWGVSAGAVTDFLGRHEGQEARLGIGYQIGPSFLFLRPGVSLQWQSADLTGYYYGVRDGEERPERPAYQPGAAVNLSVGLAGRYAISRRWGAFFSVNHTWLDPAIADSPIVGRDRRWSGVTALTYTF